MTDLSDGRHEPLAVPSKASTRHQPVVLALEEGPGLRAAALRALTIAIERGSELIAVLVRRDTEPFTLGDGPAPRDLDELIGVARAAGIRARYLMRFGDADTIAEAARDLDAQLIVCPSGTTAGHLARTADRPVLCVQSWAPCSVDFGWRHRPPGASS